MLVSQWQRREGKDRLTKPAENGIIWSSSPWMIATLVVLGISDSKLSKSNVRACADPE